jgi:hypothetical protein
MAGCQFRFAQRDQGAGNPSRITQLLAQGE